MIAANELRIGNWVNIVSKNNCKVLHIDGDEKIVGVTVSGATNIVYFSENFTGIPLTPEILEKCGFVRKGHTSSNGSKLVIHHPESFYPNGRVYFNSWAIKNEIPKYLHQLQNLYFALTGEELTVNL